MKRVRNFLKKYFIPHPDNDHKPHILRPQAIKFIALVILGSELVFVFSLTYVIPHSKLFGVILVNALVDETNQNRSANQLPTLTVNPLLQAAAQEKANDMVTNNYFAHTSPAGLTPWYWFQQVGYNFDYAGENLAVNFSNSQDVTNAWMNSPEHRANILNTDFTQIGIATAQGTFQGQPATYVVELFGTPAPAAAPIAFVNAAAAANPPTTPTTPPAPVKKAPAPAPKKTTVATVTPVPTIIASGSIQDSSSQQLFVAVKGVSVENTSTVSATSAPITGAIPVAAATDNSSPIEQSNGIQRAFSDPKTLANDFYLFLITLFAVALGLNVFIKMRIQHPNLIFSGMLVIAIAAVCIVLNQNLSLLHATIL